MGCEKKVWLLTQVEREGVHREKEEERKVRMSVLFEILIG